MNFRKKNISTKKKRRYAPSAANTHFIYKSRNKILAVRPYDIFVNNIEEIEEIQKRIEAKARQEADEAAKLANQPSLEPEFSLHEILRAQKIIGMD